MQNHGLELWEWLPEGLHISCPTGTAMRRWETFVECDQHAILQLLAQLDYSGAAQNLIQNMPLVQNAIAGLLHAIPRRMNHRTQVLWELHLRLLATMLLTLVYKALTGLGATHMKECPWDLYRWRWLGNEIQIKNNKNIEQWVLNIFQWDVNL